MKKIISLSLAIIGVVVFSGNVLSATKKQKSKNPQAKKEVVKKSKSNGMDGMFFGIEFSNTGIMYDYDYSYDNDTTDPTSFTSSENYQMQGNYSGMGFKVGKMLDGGRIYFTLNQVNSTDSIDMKTFSYDKIFQINANGMEAFIGGSYLMYSAEFNPRSYNNPGGQSFDGKVKFDDTAILLNIGTILKTKDDIDIEIGYRHSIIAGGNDSNTDTGVSSVANRKYDVTAINTLYFGINKLF
ncbi:MAG: hypothetical protein DRQ51_09825 [Gammaproteobacteria bacterium]|nr:MAG: hypothetical protein DRQ51_09825 [Gammaproteobacteria bacterium]